MTETERVERMLALSSLTARCRAQVERNRAAKGLGPYRPPQPLLGVAANRLFALEWAQRVAPVIAEIRSQGVTSLYGIAKGLNARGLTGRGGGQCTAHTVKRMLERLRPAE